MATREAACHCGQLRLEVTGDDAVAHLRRAIDMWAGCRSMATEDSDFDPIRDEPAFQDLVGR